jgi:hypothetical protein
MHLRSIAAGLLLALAAAGCASSGSYRQSSGTNVDLSKRNYKVLKANAVGTSKGFKLLGIIPFASPTYTDAMTDLYDNARVQAGSATACANVSEDSGGLYLILFSIPKLTVRADIIEFTE